MRDISPPDGCTPGRYKLVAISAKAASEWADMLRKRPENTARAYERLSNEPLSRYPGRQNPLRGKPNKPFWELEAGSDYRVLYAVSLQMMTIIIAVCADKHTGAAIGALVQRRGSPAHDLELVEDV